MQVTRVSSVTPLQPVGAVKSPTGNLTPAAAPPPPPPPSAGVVALQQATTYNYGPLPFSPTPGKSPVGGMQRPDESSDGTGMAVASPTPAPPSSRRR